MGSWNGENACDDFFIGLVDLDFVAGFYVVR